MTSALARRALSAAPVLWMLAIVAVSVAPGRVLPDLTGKDKVAHALAYAILGTLLLAWMVVVRARAPRRAWPVAVMIASLLGAALEGVQHFVPGRFASLDDAIANAVGALVGAALAALALRGRAAPAGS